MGAPAHDASTNACPKCGRPLSRNAVLGLCPRCLVHLAATDDEEPAVATPDLTPTPAAPSPETGVPGRLGAGGRIGSYQLRGEIARGGMGVVYRAYQPNLRREVALKLIRAGELATPAAIRRFQTEAEAAAQLHHPHIVPIYEVGEHDCRHFFAMRLIEGPTLAARLADPAAPLTPASTARLVATVARAVHYAHQRGILHRDLKPANILLDAEGTPYVSDFGLAKRTDTREEATLSGMLLGTPNYVSPEQAAGLNDQLTLATDIFSLGTVLYEMLAGRPPFQADTPFATLRCVVDQEPRLPSLMNPAVPRDLEIICLKCLEKDPTRRYRSAEALAEDLERWLRGEPVLARPVGSGERALKWVRRNPWMFAALSLAGAALMAWLVTQAVMSARLARANAATLAANRHLAANLRQLEWQKAEKLALEGKSAESLAWFAKFSRTAPDDPVAASRLLSRLSYWNFALPEHAPLPHDGRVARAEFLPDGIHLVTSSADRSVRLWDLESWTPKRTWTFASPVEFSTVSPDGTRLAVATRDHAVHLLATGSDGMLASWTNAIQDPRLLRIGGNGTQLAFPAFGNLGIRCVDLLRAEPSAIQYESGSTVSWMEFAPRTGWIVALDPLPHLGLHAWNVDVARPVWSEPPGNERHIAALGFTPDGQTLVVGHTNGSLALLDAATGRERRRSTVTPLQDQPSRLMVSPDGHWAVTVHFFRLAQVWDLTTLTPLPFPKPVVDWMHYAEFSPDSRRLVTGSRQGVVRVFELPSLRQVFEPIEHEGPVTSVSFSPDHRRLVTASQDGTARLWDVRMKPSPPRVQRQPGDVRFLRFSPDGGRILAGRPTGIVEHSRQEFGAGHGVVTTEALFSADWSTDERWIFVGSGSNAVVWATTNTTTPRFTRAHPAPLGNGAFTPDGRTLITTARDHVVRLWSMPEGEPRGLPLTHPDEIVTLTCGPDSTAFATGSFDGSARVGSTTTGEWLSAPLRHKGLIWQVAFDPSGQRLATASADKTAQVWDWRTGKQIGQAMRHEKGVYNVMFNPAGDRILTASEDGTARIWNAATGQPLSPAMPHQAPVWGIAFSPDGRTVATGSNDGSARLWDAATGLPLSEPLRPSAEPIGRVVFSPDGRSLLTGSQDGSVALWPVLRAPTPVPEWMTTLADRLAGRRIDDRGDVQAAAEVTLEALALQSQSAGADTYFARWARWFFEQRRRDDAPGFPVP